ncbi:dihydroneopterin aldolase [Sphingomonas sp. SORGH_AS802]|uniref:dihydroneopterin aldolase n=1 Tax=unclassified Sphingomonas TaxID=196159 RepID=UPI002860E617|nr:MULTISPECIES: dihydroneopterin aldolase [unclassified Sphingomonas]MDR6125472.1 dihydroneopterin aldolase [Sphingomonas sp. SORGH_AS_0438]MDR6134088.1 dihydroneopterin aldolase [Sphingomonas sp. SORGH_AS_0802]
MADYAILIDDFDVAIRLGIHPHEAAPQRVRLSIRLDLSYPAAPMADRIDEVFDYDQVRAAVLALAAGPGFALQESLCDSIAVICLADARVRSVRVRSMKLDIYPDATVGCEVMRGR